MVVNGKTVEYRPMRLLDFLQAEGYRPEHVVVERGQDIITRERFGAIQLQEDDELNVLYFMGGG